MEVGEDMEDTADTEVTEDGAADTEEDGAVDMEDTVVAGGKQWIDFKNPCSDIQRLPPNTETCPCEFIANKKTFL